MKILTLMVMAMAMATAVGCGPASSTADDQPIVDAHTAAPGLTAATVACEKMGIRTTTQADGSKTETTTIYSLLDVAPTDDFLIENCNLVATPTPVFCPAGTCVNSGDPTYDFSDFCNTGHSGQFVNGKLYVFCGTIQRNYNAAGTLTSVGGQRYTSVRLYR